MRSGVRPSVDRGWTEWEGGTDTTDTSLGPWPDSLKPASGCVANAAGSQLKGIYKCEFLPGPVVIDITWVDPGVVAPPSF